MKCRSGPCRSWPDELVSANSPHVKCKFKTPGWPCLIVTKVQKIIPIYVYITVNTDYPEQLYSLIRIYRTVLNICILLKKSNYSRHLYQTACVCRLSLITLTLSIWQTKIDTSVPVQKRVNPDETARDEPSHQDLHFLPFRFWFLTETPICTSGRVQIQGRKNPLQKLKGERVNTQMSKTPP